MALFTLNHWLFRGGKYHRPGEAVDLSDAEAAAVGAIAVESSVPAEMPAPAERSVPAEPPAATSSDDEEPALDFDLARSAEPSSAPATKPQPSIKGSKR